jgi:hypothetical protein
VPGQILLFAVFPDRFGRIDEYPVGCLQIFEKPFHSPHFHANGAPTIGLPGRKFMLVESFYASLDTVFVYSSDIACIDRPQKTPGLIHVQCDCGSAAAFYLQVLLKPVQQLVQVIHTPSLDSYCRYGYSQKSLEV